MLSDEFHGSVETVACVAAWEIYMYVRVCGLQLQRPQGIKQWLQTCHVDLCEEVTEKTRRRDILLM